MTATTRLKIFRRVIIALTLLSQQTYAKEIYGLDVTGYLDSSYNYLSEKNKFTSGTFSRLNDVEPNGFTLQQATVTISKLPDQGPGGLLTILSGRDANGQASAGWNPYFGSQTLTFDPYYFYLQYAWGPFSLMGGKFSSLAGYETFDTTIRNNFSASLIDSFAEPGTVVGLRGTYTANKKLSIYVGVNNGWDTIHHINWQRTLELGTSWQPNNNLSVTASIYSGVEYLYDSLANGPKGTRNYADIFAIYKLNESWELVVNGDYGVQSKALQAEEMVGHALWEGIAAYATYHFNCHWYSTFRGEIFNDKDGNRTGVRQSMKELTLTLGFTPIKSLIFRAETRHDFSSNASFVKNNSISASNNLQSYAVEGIFQFL